jgi:hypothetical protein
MNTWNAWKNQICLRSSELHIFKHNYCSKTVTRTKTALWEVYTIVKILCIYIFFKIKVDCWVMRKMKYNNQHEENVSRLCFQLYFSEIYWSQSVMSKYFSHKKLPLHQTLQSDIHNFLVCQNHIRVLFTRGCTGTVKIWGVLTLWREWKNK